MSVINRSSYQQLFKRVESLEDETFESEHLLDVMVPYADLMTLLLVFFVFFFIISGAETKDETVELDTSLDLNEQVITIPSSILFEVGKAELKWEALQALSEAAIGIKNITGTEPGWQIRIEGHTDNIPIKTKQYESNWELSTARALSVVKFFLTHNYFAADQLQAMGYGEHRPVEPNDSEENRAKNRRVEIRLSKKAL
jgi:flagellar motor protein MotB